MYPEVRVYPDPFDAQWPSWDQVRHARELRNALIDHEAIPLFSSEIFTPPA